MEGAVLKLDFPANPLQGITLRVKLNLTRCGLDRNFFFWGGGSTPVESLKKKPGDHRFYWSRGWGCSAVVYNIQGLRLFCSGVHITSCLFIPQIYGEWGSMNSKLLYWWDKVYLSRFRKHILLGYNYLFF